MESILYQLFIDDYDITPKPDKKQQQLARQILGKWEKIEAALGLEFVNHLAELEGEQEDWRNYQYFRSGFRLGIRLLLVALG